MLHRDSSAWWMPAQTDAKSPVLSTARTKPGKDDTVRQHAVVGVGVSSIGVPSGISIMRGLGQIQRRCEHSSMVAWLLAVHVCCLPCSEQQS